MKLLLTGVTGAGTCYLDSFLSNTAFTNIWRLAGIQTYRTAIQDTSISKITLLIRRPLPSWIPESPKTEVIVLKDFLAYPDDLPARLAEHNACIWALGTTSVGKVEDEYTKITYGYVMAAVKALQDGGIVKRKDAANPFRFVFVSGEAADQTEKSFIMFARVKVGPLISCFG